MWLRSTALFQAWKEKQKQRHTGDRKWKQHTLHILRENTDGKFSFLKVHRQRRSSFCWRLCKGKAVPLQAWTGPQGSRRLRPPELLTIGSWRWYVVSLTHRPPLPPGLSWYSFLEAESTPGHMELSDATGKIPGDTGNRSRDLPTCS